MESDIAITIAFASIICGIYFISHACCGASVFLQPPEFLTRHILTPAIRMRENNSATTSQPPLPMTAKPVQKIESPVAAWNDQGKEASLTSTQKMGSALFRDPSLFILEDYDAIAAGTMPHDEDIVEDNYLHWDIEKWDALPEKVRSPAINVGGHQWSLLLYPKGNNAPDQVSAYLELTNATTSPDEYAYAQFAIFISNRKDPNHFMYKVGRHLFCAAEPNWGFPNFAHLDSLAGYGTPSDQRILPFLHEGEVRVSVVIRVSYDPTWVSRQKKPAKNDSKKMTGYVGLKNQGATCYMNAVFQSLYCTTAFRKAMYDVLTNQGGRNATLPLAIQRLFYNMQHKDIAVGKWIYQKTSTVGARYTGRTYTGISIYRPISDGLRLLIKLCLPVYHTADLTRSFGWGPMEVSVQRDAHEFCQSLLRNLEERMRETPVQETIRSLFYGSMTSYVRCINVDFESTQSEAYSDISLNVIGCKNLEESFTEYIAADTLDGDNQYCAYQHGFQDAMKGIVFESFPPVLHLQLKRFEFNFEQGGLSTKSNNRFEFPLEIDLEKFLCPTADRSQSHKYVLHGVLVHSGVINGGHYFGYLKPSKDGGWLKFDDDRVTAVTVKEVLKSSYGGERLGGIGPHLYQQGTSAYMLVYIRACMEDKILPKMNTKDIPAHLVERFTREQLAHEAKQEELKVQSFYLTAQIFTVAAFTSNHGPEFIQTFENLPANAIFSHRARRDQKFRDFKKDLAESLNRPPSSFNLWSVVTRHNQTLRPDTLLDENTIGDESLENVQRTFMDKYMGLFLEDNPGRKQGFSEIAQGEKTRCTICQNPGPLESQEDVLVLVKCFDPKIQALRGIGTMRVSKTDRIGERMESIRNLVGFAPGERLNLFEEVKPGSVEILQHSMTFEEAGIRSGDIISVQRIPEEEELRMLKRMNLHIDVHGHLADADMGIDVLFKPSSPHQGAPFSVTLRKDMNYNAMIQKVAEMLGVDPESILLYKRVGSKQMWIELRRTFQCTLSDMLSDVNPSEGIVLYYMSCQNELT